MTSDRVLNSAFALIHLALDYQPRVIVPGCVECRLGVPGLDSIGSDPAPAPPEVALN